MAEEDSEVGKIAKTAGTCREIYSAISAAKGKQSVGLVLVMSLALL